MERTIKVGEQEVKFKATALTPNIYRQTFQRDLFDDMTALHAAYESGDNMSSAALIMFQQIAYVMAKQADPDVPDDPDEWLDQFDMFSIYQILPQIIELWGINTITLSKSKKKGRTPTAR